MRQIRVEVGDRAPRVGRLQVRVAAVAKRVSVSRLVATSSLGLLRRARYGANGNGG